MRHFVFLNILIAVFGLVPLSYYSQNSPTAEQQQIEHERMLEADVDRRAGELSKLQNTPPTRSTSKKEKGELKAIKEAALEATRMFARMITPDPEDAAKYKAVLTSGKSGLIRLLSNHDCVTSNVIRTDGKCEGFMDGGSAYSFRTTRYFTIAGGHLSRYRLSDLEFNQDVIRSKGFFEHGIMVSLGDVPVEDVKLSDAGLKFIVNFKPPATRPEADAFEARLDNKIVSGNYTYSNSIAPAVNATFAMRLIAYKASKFEPNVDLDTKGYNYLWLQYDKRADMTIVFRVVSRDADGNLTLLWKELEHKKAPSLKY